MDPINDKMIYEEAQNCVRCGTCRVIYADRIKSKRFGAQCPPATYYKVESFSPAGRMYTAVGIMRDQLQFNKRAVETFYACTQCGYCQTMCEEYVEVQTMPVIEAMRTRAVKEGVGPLPDQKNNIENFKNTGNIYGDSPDKRFAWLKDIDKNVKDFSKGDTSDTLFYVGSNYSISPSTETIPLEIAKILQRAGFDFGILGLDEKSSGYHMLSLGERDIFVQTAEENIKTFNDLKIKTIIVSCPEDFHTIKMRYPGIAPLSAEVIHITELFDRLIKDKAITLKSTKRRVTYHDPCHLGRHSRLYEAPRNVISAIPGIELVEMERNRRDAWCCGAGGGVKLANKDYALATGMERIDEAAETGADALVTACPLCIEHFNDIKQNSKSPLDIIDVSALLFKVLM
jgi:Fe-S oxidoreductase